jgi:UDP-2-acetamido-2,6-beta-L-arabino-hexul-4-ose reductase
MNILVTGAKGFVGRNLCAALKNVKDGCDKTHPDLVVDAVYEYDIDSSMADLDRFCSDADFIFNLAGVNRPKDDSEFMKGNFGFATTLFDFLKKNGNKCPVMLSSSIQATLNGRFGDSEYGRSKKAGEELFFKYGEETGAKVLVYRFPNLFGKWCRPNYNSAVATFCNNIANNLPINVNDPSVEMELLYIDDLVAEMFLALEGKEHRDGKYCKVPVTHKILLGGIVDFLKKFASQPSTLVMPELPDGSFEKKLYSTYLSYLPKNKIAYDLKVNADSRGSFTELLKTEKCGQFSVNVIKPGQVKGQHWHNTKWEIFMTVSGRGLVQLRKKNLSEVIELEVSGEKLRAVQMLPGYTHNIINTSKTEDMIVFIWANELFDSNRPDTFHEDV